MADAPETSETSQTRERAQADRAVHMEEQLRAVTVGELRPLASSILVVDRARARSRY